jgi:hypothetical protein
VPDFELVDVIHRLVQYPLAEVEEQLTEPSRFIDVAAGDYPKYDLFTDLIVAARGYASPKLRPIEKSLKS